jgi:hypothetical protein
MQLKKKCLLALWVIVVAVVCANGQGDSRGNMQPDVGAPLKSLDYTVRRLVSDLRATNRRVSYIEYADGLRRSFHVPLERPKSGQLGDLLNSLRGSPSLEFNLDPAQGLQIRSLQALKFMGDVPSFGVVRTITIKEGGFFQALKQLADQTNLPFISDDIGIDRSGEITVAEEQFVGAKPIDVLIAILNKYSRLGWNIEIATNADGELVQIRALVY